MAEGVKESSVEELHTNLLKFSGGAGIQRKSMNLGTQTCFLMPFLYQ
jgi:hypothetical protein